jgi:hypothetical protein
MTWCSVELQGQLYLYLYLYHNSKIVSPGIVVCSYIPLTLNSVLIPDIRGHTVCLKACLSRYYFLSEYARIPDV